MIERKSVPSACSVATVISSEGRKINIEEQNRLKNAPEMLRYLNGHSALISKLAWRCYASVLALYLLDTQFL